MVECPTCTCVICTDVLGVVSYFFKLWRGDKKQALSQISTSISGVLAYRKTSYISLSLVLSWLVFNMVIKFVFITKSGWCWLSIVQPQIVIVGDPHDIDLLYIITARGKCNLSAPTRKKLEYSNWVTWLIYIFNLSYNLSKVILTFLEEAFLEIGCRQTLATVFSFFNDLANAWGSPCWNVMFW